MYKVYFNYIACPVLLMLVFDDNILPVYKLTFLFMYDIYRSIARLKA